MELRAVIDEAWQQRQALTAVHRDAILETIAALDSGRLRVASKEGTTWQVNTWVKQAILLYFSIAEMREIHSGDQHYYDKIPTKTNLKEQGIRVVPPGTVRYGAFLEPGCIVMPGYVNIGAYVGAGSMVDTWATVGSCAQIGKNVHLSGGVGIGGVLEPPQASPVIVEDGAFIGSRCIVVEGVRIGEQAVLGAGVVLTASTAIVDVSGTEEKTFKGMIPPRSVVIPSMRKKSFAAGTYDVPCALVIGQRQESTDLKTSLNEVLRRFSLSV